jgi:hypothetical protein
MLSPVVDVSLAALATDSSSSYLINDTDSLKAQTSTAL